MRVISARSTSLHVYFSVIALAALGLYWLSALVLESRDEMYLFGADTPLYMELAKGDVFSRIGSNYHLDRVARFHPVTTALAVAWMESLSPLTHWVTPQHLLKAMFAAVGAVGVWAAMSAFAAVIPRRYVMLLGVIYAASLGIWYFASIEESKIVTATLTALYIATYLHLRNRWTMRGAVVLTAILLLACLNEVVAGFLVIIPVVDTLVRRGWDLRHGRWIAWHGLVAPVAFLFLEGVVNARLVGVGTDLEGKSHLSMLVYYVSRSDDFSATSLYSFLVNWLFFSIAAPTVRTSLAPPAWPQYTGYFEPTLANYFSSPVSAGLVGVFGVMLVASVLPRYRQEDAGSLNALLLALFAYALLRGTFFFVLNPGECLLFSSGVTLAHILLISIPFTASRLPAKQGLLAALAVLLFITNGRFIIGR